MRLRIGDYTKGETLRNYVFDKDNEKHVKLINLLPTGPVCADLFQTFAPKLNYYTAILNLWVDKGSPGSSIKNEP